MGFPPVSAKADQVSLIEIKVSHFKSSGCSASQPLSRVRSVWIFEDPFGKVIAEASHDREEILVVDCDPARTEDVRRNWPFLRDRRIDSYSPILKRFID